MGFYSDQNHHEWISVQQASYLRPQEEKVKFVWMEKLGTLKTGGIHAAVCFTVFYFSVCYLKA
jgi:hypothetical protein